jgi:hypothetical protein
LPPICLLGWGKKKGWNYSQLSAHNPLGLWNSSPLNHC